MDDRAVGTLPDELLLLAYRELGRRTGRWSAELGYGLAAAILLELTWAGRITVRPAEISVRDASKMADWVADAVLERIVLADRAWSARDWVEKTVPDVFGDVRAKLVAGGLLVAVPRRLFGLLPLVEYRAAADGRPGGDGEQRRIEVLAALVGAMGMTPLVDVVGRYGSGPYASGPYASGPYASGPYASGSTRTGEPDGSATTVIVSALSSAVLAATVVACSLR